VVILHGIPQDYEVIWRAACSENELAWERNVPSSKRKSNEKIKKLLELLKDWRALLIVMQDNPDPDSIASAAALRRIANKQGDVQCSISYGGVIGRAENRALVEYVGLNFRPIGEIDFKKFDAIALVDTQPNTGNNSLPPEILPQIVLDHHPLQPDTRKILFTDVRSKYGALSTVLYEYLTEAGITPDPPLATALLYAIRSDTQDLGPKAIQADVAAAETLFTLANTRMLSAIQRRNVPQEYFQNLADSLKNARVVGPCITAGVGQVGNPDMIAEMADLLLRHDGVNWVMCYGCYRDKCWISLRTSQTEIHAGELMKRLMSKLGTGGGHETSAGGQVPLTKGTQAEREAVHKTIRERLLRALRIEQYKPKKLVSV
jgi:nanoRNase/pAp phosphatase (c-di-AMP/oligoRNAs hydrolase)